MERQKSVSLCIIAKDEEAAIGRCLASVKNLVDEIILVDTGSTDKTCGIAAAHGAKVIPFTWDNDFSRARNFSLSYANSDWILLLDADEELLPASREPFIEFINTSPFDGCHFSMHNLLNHQGEFTVHEAFRLLRNNGSYHFRGAIHEQIVRKDGLPSPGAFTSDSRIIVNHYGYLEEIVAAKKKRDRNIPILEKEIAQDPHNAFTLFNLGNEYLAQNQTEEAYRYYRQAYGRMDVNQAYAPHLYYRMILCLKASKAYTQAIKLCDEALGIYPKCTDILYMKGRIYVDTNALFPAEACFLKCLEIGEPPGSLKFLNGCGNFRAALALGELYQENEDLDRSLDYYNLALKTDGSLYSALYAIGTVLSKKYGNPDQTAAHLASYFSNLNHVPNAMVYCDILLNNKIIGPVLTILERIPVHTAQHWDRLFITSKISFLTQQWARAYEGFYKISQMGAGEAPILSHCLNDSLWFLGIIGLADKKYAKDSLILLNQKNQASMAMLFERLGSLAVKGRQTSKELTDDCLPLLDRYFDDVLRAELYDLFTQSLEILNHFSSRDVLLRLASVYHKNGLKSLAGKTVLRSVRELDFITPESALLLARDLPFN